MTENGNVELVVGATYPELLKNVPEKYAELLLLIPASGTQGGDLSDGGEILRRCQRGDGNHELLKTIIVLYGRK